MGGRRRLADRRRHRRRLAINEKGAIAATDRLEVAPASFAEQAHGLLARLGTSPEELTAALDAGAMLVARVSAACGRSV